MEFGIALPTAAHAWKVVKRAEELGFHHAWFYDTQMLCADCFVAMGAAYANHDQLESALKYLTKALEIDPAHPNAQKYLEVRERNVPSGSRGLPGSRMCTVYRVCVYVVQATKLKLSDRECVRHTTSL